MLYTPRTPGPWVALVYASGVANYNTSSGTTTYYDARSRINNDYLELRGLIVANTAQAQNAPLFTLPTGQRPARQATGITNAKSAPYQFAITTAGAFEVNVALAANDFVFLDNIAVYIGSS